MARYATESRVSLTQPASALPVRIFGVIVIMYKVSTPFPSRPNILVGEIFLDQAMQCRSGRAIGLSRRA